MCITWFLYFIWANYYCLIVSLYINTRTKAWFSLRSICVTKQYQITQLSTFLLKYIFCHLKCLKTVLKYCLALVKPSICICINEFSQPVSISGDIIFYVHDIAFTLYSWKKSVWIRQWFSNILVPPPPPLNLLKKMACSTPPESPSHLETNKEIYRNIMKKFFFFIMLNNIKLLLFIRHDMPCNIFYNSAF